MNSAALTAAKSQLRSFMKQQLANISQDSIVAQSESLTRSYMTLHGINRGCMYI